MKEIYLESEYNRCLVTEDDNGIHFQDLNDGEEIWITDENINKLIEFLQDN